jgi:VWFA-related protein
VDVSGSQAAFIKRHRRTVAQFLTQVLGPKDRAFLVTIGPDVRLIGDLTGSTEELRRSVDLIDVYQTHGVQLGEPCSGTDLVDGCGGTALWNGVYAAANQKLRWVQGRKALIILSDGLDTGSMHSLEDAIESAQEAETVVYAIKYVDPALTPAEAGVSKRMAAVRGLERLTELTGGYTFPNPDDDLDMVFARIEDDLRNLYVLAFTPPVAARDGRFHKLEVTMARKDFKDFPVRARNGYYAQERR